MGRVLATVARWQAGRRVSASGYRIGRVTHTEESRFPFRVESALSEHCETFPILHLIPKRTIRMADEGRWSGVGIG